MRSIKLRGTKRLTLVLVTAMAAVFVASGVALAAVVEGGTGDNTLRGTEGADTINGNDGRDTVYGMAGDDDLDGGDGGDQLFGGDESSNLTGDDTIYGRHGNDLIVGGPGADVLGGGSYNDVIYEGPPDDAAADTLSGGAEDDQFYAANGQSVVDRVTCGEGRDEAWVDSGDTVAADCEVVHRDPSVAEVEFSQPQQVEQVMQVSDQFGADIERIQSEFDAGVPMMDAVEPTASTAAGIEQGFEEERLSAFRDIVNTSEKLTPAERADVQPKVDAMRAALARNDAGAVTVTQALFAGDLEDLEALQVESGASTETGSAVESVAVADTLEMAQHDAGEAAEAPESSATTTEEEVAALTDPNQIEEDTGPDTDPELAEQDGYTPEGGTFWPNTGYSEIKPSATQGKRFSLQGFRWGNKCCFSDSGYEHDLKLSIANNRTYLSGSVVNNPRNCMPKGAYWSTDLPKSGLRYLDTNRTAWGWCDRNWRAFTIGIVNGSAAKSDTSYFTYIRMPNGRDGRDSAILEGERTTQRPGPCRGPRQFCVTGERDPNLIDTPVKHNGEKDVFTVPSFRRWTEYNSG